MGRTKERNVKIELIRLAACLLVIMQHITIVPVIGETGELNKGIAALVAVFYTDVPLFLIISGFLMFQKSGTDGIEHLWQSYWHKLKNMLLYVFLPSCIIVFVSAVVAPVLTGEMSWQELIAAKDMTLPLVCIRNYIMIQQTASLYQIFWYLWVHIKVILFFPLLAVICQNTEDKNRIRRFLMLLSWLNVLLNDFQVIGWWGGNFDSITFDKYFLFVLLGYEIYLFVQKAEQKKICRYGAVMFTASILVGVLVENYFYRKQTLQYMPVVFTVSASVGLFLLLYALPEPKTTRVWNYLGKATLYIYMVHILVIFSCERIWGDFFLNLFGGGENVFGLIVYDIVYGALIFVLAMAFGLIFKLFYEKIILFVIEKVYSAIKRVGKGSNE